MMPLIFCPARLVYRYNNIDSKLLFIRNKFGRIMYGGALGFAFGLKILRNELRVHTVS
jgi:hypothetical protein